MDTAISNVNGKIWLFIDSEVEWELLIDTKQLGLWDNLYYLVADMELPWVVRGDFNVILNEDEKIGGLLVYPPEVEDFALCVNFCCLFDTGYKGRPFTWEEAPQLVKPFKFLNFWTTHSTFTCVVKQNLVADFVGDPFLMFKQKLKRLAIREDIVRIKEMLFKEEPTIENRIVLQQGQVELKKCLNFEEQFWKQKADMNWFTEGDRNTIFFHNHVNGKR
ncbi:uncharacterized protein LOC142166460 [Nicotiana tabacum]|uniref:Uncharacterized protein LOC142166460 n=1 Tax=Nicotiana tabacum TaxID=4097 RepID=A0AC58SAE1_TOBAC